jgi:hypothetical protein
MFKPISLSLGNMNLQSTDQVEIHGRTVRPIGPDGAPQGISTVRAIVQMPKNIQSLPRSILAHTNGLPTMDKRSAQGHRDMCSCGPLWIDRGRSTVPKTQLFL